MRTPTPLEGAQTSGTHQPKPVVVITVVWIVVVAERAASVVMIVVPRPAAQHPPGALQGTPQPVVHRLLNQYTPKIHKIDSPDGERREGASATHLLLRSTAPNSEQQNL